MEDIVLSMNTGGKTFELTQSDLDAIEHYIEQKREGKAEWAEFNKAIIQAWTRFHWLHHSPTDELDHFADAVKSIVMDYEKATAQQNEARTKLLEMGCVN